MMAGMKCCFFILIIFVIVKSGYPSIGDDVASGNVLLPATRRGRYLANIVRRQAVDGTGIRFNKNADRINAEAKKKVDVLSEELLPYIIAEQERRITLYNRVMTAIQNGEKGVTIAEIRNKPPLMIRKGLMYRCPSNRSPREPDGSGLMMCEGDVEPSPIMYDSCLSAEDKELYVAENKFFFCNRHKEEGADLPRNGTTVIACAPIERTSLEYTIDRCALGDTDDVVVHYRYYPDRTYKYVTELDPENEVCEHWYPCQVAYIYSLPSPDQAMVANELWHDYKPNDYETLPDDSLRECMNPTRPFYKHSPRRVKIPAGYHYKTIWKGDCSAPITENHKSNSHKVNYDHGVKVSENGQYLEIDIRPFSVSWSMISDYHVRFEMETEGKILHKLVPFLTLINCTVLVDEKSIDMMPAQRIEPIVVNYQCTRCSLLQIVIRSTDWNVYSLDRSRYRTRQTVDRKSYIEINLENLKFQDFGSYFAVFNNDDGVEEQVKILVVKSPERVLKAQRLKNSISVGDHFVQNVSYACNSCEVVDVLCRGESALTSGKVSIFRNLNTLTFNFPSFEDSNSCVYMAVFNSTDKVYRNVIAVIDNVTVTGAGVVNAPKVGEPFEQEIPVSCLDCFVEKVSVNGIPLEDSVSRRSGTGSLVFYETTPSSITIRITKYVNYFEGVFQAIFNSRGEMITKTIMELKEATKTNEVHKVGDNNIGDGNIENEELTTVIVEEMTTAADGGETSAVENAGSSTIELSTNTTEHVTVTVDTSAAETTVPETTNPDISTASN